MKEDKVLVTDAQMRSSLAVIRSLGRKGLKVIAAEETKFATGFYSKYCKKGITYPSPRKDRETFVKWLLKTLSEGDYRMLFPVADASLGPVVENMEKLSEFTIVPLPPPEIFLKAYDKGATLREAIKLGVPCPDTYFVDDPTEVKTLSRELEYPVLIKPRVGFGRRGVKVCNSPEELRENFGKITSEWGRVIIQEYIPFGGEFGVYTLLNFNSEPRGLTVQRRIRSYPVSGGPSTLRETVKDNITEEAVKTAFRLLKHLRWYGVAMVEFRVDQRDGIPKLMEINPRFWGSLQLSILAGVDFPYLLYRLFIDGDVEPFLDYEVGVQCRWLLPGDILWFISAPGKLKNLRDFMRFKTNYDILSFQDPGPTFGFMLATARYIFDPDMWKFVLRRG